MRVLVFLLYEIAEKIRFLNPLGFKSKVKWKVTAKLAYAALIFVAAVMAYGCSKDTYQSTAINGQLKVHYLNVGKADSILIQQGGKNMLIDAGDDTDANTIIGYLKDNGVSKLDIVVATHPHKDHIGAMDEVIKTFKIGTIYTSNEQTKTKTYKNFIKAVKKKDLKLTRVQPGMKFNLGDVKCTILAPNSESYEDLNDYSVVVRMTYGTTKFIFQGDAKDVSEYEIINKGNDIAADVIKIGHHGSSTSSTQQYLNKVKPKYAVISVGEDDDSGLPSEVTILRLENMGIRVYRTDKDGTVVAVSDGKNISFSTNLKDYN